MSSLTRGGALSLLQTIIDDDTLLRSDYETLVADIVECYRTGADLDVEAPYGSDGETPEQRVSVALDYYGLDVRNDQDYCVTTLYQESHDVVVTADSPERALELAREASADMARTGSCESHKARAWRAAIVDDIEEPDLLVIQQGDEDGYRIEDPS